MSTSPEAAAQFAGEVVTDAKVRYVELPGVESPLALITLDNGKDHKRPSTLGPRTMRELSDVLDTLRDAAGKGEVQAVAITGKEYCFAAGADLSQAAALPSREVAHELGVLGHAGGTVGFHARHRARRSLLGRAEGPGHGRSGGEGAVVGKGTVDHITDLAHTADGRQIAGRAVPCVVTGSAWWRPLQWSA